MVTVLSAKQVRLNPYASSTLVASAIIFGLTGLAIARGRAEALTVFTEVFEA